MTARDWLSSCLAPLPAIALASVIRPLPGALALASFAFLPRALSSPSLPSSTWEMTLVEVPMLLTSDQNQIGGTCPWIHPHLRLSDTWRLRRCGCRPSAYSPRSHSFRGPAPRGSRSKAATSSSGGSSSIGLAMATAATREGAWVSILARNLAGLEEARAAIQRDTGHDDVVVHAADVRDARAVVRALREAGPVNVLVYNHGMFMPQELERQDMDEIKWMVDINLMGTFHLIKAVLPDMKVGIYGYTAYSASKFALRGLGEALQHEVVVDNIHVSLIFPPDTETLGFEEEHKRRPELTNIMAGSSGGMKADDVANKALDGIKSAKFIVPCNFEGTMLAVATAGLFLQSSPLMAFIEEILPGSPWFTQDWDCRGFSRATSSPRNQILSSQGFVGLTSV